MADAGVCRASKAEPHRRCVMDKIRLSVVSSAALLALAATASAGPMSVASSDVITPPNTQIQLAAGTTMSGTVAGTMDGTARDTTTTLGTITDITDIMPGIRRRRL